MSVLSDNTNRRITIQEAAAHATDKSAETTKKRERKSTPSGNKKGEVKSKSARKKTAVPNVMVSGATNEQGVVPDVHNPEATTEQAAVPDALNPKATNGQTAASNVTVSGAATKQAAIPDTLNPKATNGETAAPNVTVSGTTTEQAITPGVLNPKADDEWVGTPCPQCGKGTLIKGKAAYGCSEWRNSCTYRKPFS